MEFKKKEKGWILEELEKKNECLDANEFGGENPEDVEKEREEKDKEINKRFEGTRKNAEKVVGKDFEEHAKPHKVEEHYVGKKDLGEAISKLKEQEIKFTVKRSQKEGFRYVLEYFSDEHKKEEPLFEKIDLEEDDAKEGFISGAEDLSYDELANLEKELFERLRKEGISPRDGTFSNSSNKLADLDLLLVINGDWKHDHLLANEIVEEFVKEKGYVIIKHTEQEIGDSQSDDYEAEHHWFLVKDADGHMEDTVNTLHQMFTPKDESLKEGVTFEVNDDGDLVAKSKDNFLIIGSEEDKDLPDEEKKERMMKVLNDFKNDDTMKSEYDYWMSVLKENFVDEVLPDAIPEEPIVVSTEPEAEVPAEPVPSEVVETGIYSALSSELRDTLQDIENLKSLAVTLVEEGREDFIEDLNAIIDERTVHMGILTSLMEKVNSKVEAPETDTEERHEKMMDAEIVEPEEEVKESLEHPTLSEYRKRLSEIKSYDELVDYVDEYSDELYLEVDDNDESLSVWYDIDDERDVLMDFDEFYDDYKRENESLNEDKDTFKDLTIEEMFFEVAGKKFKVFDKNGHFTKEAWKLYDKVAKKFGDYDEFDALCGEEGCFEDDEDIQYPANESLDKDVELFKKYGANPSKSSRGWDAGDLHKYEDGLVLSYSSKKDAEEAANKLKQDGFKISSIDNDNIQSNGKGLEWNIYCFKESLNESVDIHVEDGNITISQDDEEVGTIAIDTEKKKKKKINN